MNDMPAFPTENAHQSGATTFHYEGISIRGYFAAKALAAIPAYGSESVNTWEAKDFSKFAFNIADAMLEEYYKEQKID